MDKKRSKWLPITYQTHERNASWWLKIIRYHESGIVIQPQDDCEYRVQQLIGDIPLLEKYLGPYHRKYLLLYVPVDIIPWEKAVQKSLVDVAVRRKIGKESKLQKMNITKIVEYLGNRGFEIGLFISRITHLLEKKNFSLFLEMEYLLERSKNFSVILFLEKDVIRKEYGFLIDKCSLLFNHLYYYPLYDEKDTRQIIHYYLSLWKAKLPKEKEDAIVQSCGGYLWPVTDTVRFLRDNPTYSAEQALDTPLTLYKLTLFWNKFTPEEKKILRIVTTGRVTEEIQQTPEYQYLSKVNLVRKTDNTNTYVGVPLLQKIIIREEMIYSLSIENGQIVYQGKNITAELTKKEKKILAYFLTHKKTIITRDDLAQAIWGKDWEEVYSDWAIDTLISRLRDKFVKLNIDKSLIKTVKKKGFIYG